MHTKSLLLKSFLPVVAGMLWAGGVTAQDAETRPGPVSDPLDPTPYRLRAAQLGDRLLPTATGTEFNPAISVIVDFIYAHFTDGLDDPPGFELGGHSHGHGHGHDHGHGIEDGFQLREVELTLTGTVDPYFDAMVMLGFSDHGVEVEEAFISSRQLPGGLQLKAGKFFSDVGYINKQHPHDWLFVDAPWMRDYLFGDHGLNEVGLQLSWLPPTETYFRLGAEVFQGESEGVANYQGPGRHEMVTLMPGAGGAPERVRWRASDGLSEKDGPRLFTVFGKLGPDIGLSHALQLGAFGGYSRAFQLTEAHSSGRLETWDGDAWFAGVDAVYKYDGRGMHGHRNLVLQAEYMVRHLSLDYRSQEFADASSFVTTHANRQNWQQDGLYVQGVYGIAPRWNVGVRVDALGLINDGYEGRGTPEDFGTSYRYTGQVSFAPTEFSRLRLQSSYLKHAGDDHDHDDAWMVALQYNISLGVHGAHAF